MLGEAPSLRRAAMQCAVALTGQHLLGIAWWDKIWPWQLLMWKQTMLGRLGLEQTADRGRGCCWW